MGTIPKCFFLSPRLQDYVTAHRSAVDTIEQELIDETDRLGDIAVMQVPPEQGALITMLARLTGARRAVEVGTFTGYSALCIARGMPPEGTLLACDISEEWTSIGRRYWEKAGVDHKIELRLGPALDTLRSLPLDPVYDLAFVDADKPSYIDYYEELVPRVRPNGLILADNVLWIGRVVDPERNDDDTVAIRRFNDHILADPRVEVVMVPISDGLTMVRKCD